MSTFNHRWRSILSLTGVAAAVLLCAPMVQAQPPAGSARHNAAKPLMTRDLIGMPGKEIVVSEVDVPPGSGSKPHRHDAQVFVYVLQGTMIMQVKGGPRMTLGPGQMFYENPSDIHILSSNASTTEPAKFLAFVIKEKGKPVSRPVPADEAK